MSFADPVPAATSLRMSRQKRRDTAPELALRRALHARGWRFRVNAPLPTMPRRSADILFTRRRVAVFVDGCFWHGCPLHANRPANNAAWWADKLESNVRRDRDTDERLMAAGWTVVRVWEHEDVDSARERVERELAELSFAPATASSRSSLAGAD